MGQTDKQTDKQTNRQTDKQTDSTVYRVAPQLKSTLTCSIGLAESCPRHHITGVDNTTLLGSDVRPAFQLVLFANLTGD